MTTTTAAEPETAAPAARRRWPFALAVALLLAQMAFVMVTTAVRQTPTIDEPVYAGAGVLYLREHTVADNAEHPPLGKLLIGAGPVLSGVHLDRSFRGDEGAVGRHLLYESGNDPGRVMLAARLPVIALTLLFGLVVLAFGADLAGRRGGLLALAVYAFSPDVIAHGSLATLDTATAGFVLTAAWLTWRARGNAGRYLPLAGLALGAAIATRMSALPAVPVVLALAALSVRPWRPWRSRAPRAVLAVAGVGAVATAVVWASYLAVDPRLRWSAPAGLPGGRIRLLSRLLPFPPAYRDGVRMQFGLEHAHWGGFLFGHEYTGPRWYYLPAALLVKEPIGLLVLGAAGCVALALVARAALPYVLLPPLVLLASVLNEARDFGVRYAIAVPVFAAVAAGAVAALRWRWAHVAAGVLAAFVAVSSLRAYPYYLPYSNEAFGGPARTYRSLHDSNVDWGQDLGRLADRLRSRYPGRPVWLVYKGSGVPAAYGIHAADPLAVPPADVTGLLVVSYSRVDRPGARLAALLATSRQVGEVGYSIGIYRRGPS